MSNVRAGISFVQTERNATATYHVYRGPDLRTALAFLRQQPVKEELVYNIVETPEGNLGNDLIYIFHEADGKPIEFVPRPSSAKPTPSAACCAWCGFFVIPIKLPLHEQKVGSVSLSLTVEQIRNLVKTGNGFRCDSCALLQCGLCSNLANLGPGTKIGCRSCGEPVKFHMQLGVETRSDRKPPVSNAHDRTVTFPPEPDGDELWGLAPLQVPWNIDVREFLSHKRLPYLWPNDIRYREYIDESGKTARAILRASWINVFLHHPNPEVVLQCLREAPPEQLSNYDSFTDLLASPSAADHVKLEAGKVFWTLSDIGIRFVLTALLSRGVVQSGYDLNSVHQAIGRLRDACPRDRLEWFEMELTGAEDD